MTSYYLDTYAMIEIINGNENYKKYLKEQFYTSVFNLYELYYSLLRFCDEDDAKKFFFYFKKGILQVKDDHIFEASRFKMKNIKKGLSYADCIGYIISLSYGMKFLTGDKEFRDSDNVEFVSK